MTTTAVHVGMAEIHLLKGSGVFSCLGLGSCVGLCALDPVANVAACAHIMLPEAFAGKPVDRPGKFANTAVPELLAMMERMGAERSRIVTAMAGGAQVFKFGANADKLNIGERNGTAVTKLLSALGLPVVGHDLGGNAGRTVLFVVESGVISVRTAAQGEKKLCSLRK